VVRLAFAILLGIAALQSLALQTASTPQTSAPVCILLPPDIRSETVQIRYFMSGPFGGYASFEEPRPSLRSYQIKSSMDDKAATQIKVLVYAPGCRIQRFDLLLAETEERKEEFSCQTLPSVTLSGQIVPSDLVRDHHAELAIAYMAFWANEFFGVADGIVPQIHLATVSPDANGMFQVRLPDFAADTTLSSFQRKPSLQLKLRDSKTWNPIASLEPELPASGR